MDAGKATIIQRFIKNVRGKKPKLSRYIKKHDGKEGHWLETRMKVKHNASNTPDLFGYEMKKSTVGKTTFGDWSADYYIFKNPDYGIDRDEFLKIFGKPNAKKAGRYSWSGEPCPNINGYNLYGQIIVVDNDLNILIKYNYSKDTRSDKGTIVPINMQVSDLLLAKWEKESIKKKVDSKFNIKGWFRCVKDANGIYTQIVFGDPLSFEKWIDGVISGDIFFDSGMYQGNVRPYSQWRANNAYWNKLITSTY